ncbi:MAG: glycosyltransferase family 39 protein [Rhodoferax sp.]|nr:glycosyltransferase family 39 protein [Rhodoferax sp.]MDP3650841.1 glycosyltransferase family 39 protein [Rhodoferax sp.]
MAGLSTDPGLGSTLASQLRWAISLTLLVNAASMLTPVVSAGDSVTYAALAQHIANTDDWVDLVLDGQDWLDKPHFPFWATALFFKIGGVNAFSYILPGYLFHLLGAYFTYRMARLFDGRTTALLALLVYVSVYHLMQSASEVKAEAYLTGSIMAACYYWLRYDAQARLKYLLLGALFTALAVMSKGVFTLITIASGLVCMWLYQKQGAKLWRPKWLLAVAVSALLTAPELIALYLQFDAHPDKRVFGHTGVSGIRFFLWDSQFGRFWNTGPIQNHNGSPLYFLHVFLWAFLPWVAVFVAALWSGMRRFSSGSVRERSGFVFLCGTFFVTFALFSATRFQLDHYTVILFPFAALVCARHLAHWLQQPCHPSCNRLVVAQLGVTLLVLSLALGLSVYVAQAALVFLVLALLCILLAYGWWMRQHARVHTVLLYPVFAINLLYVFLELMHLSAYTHYSIPYNASQLLAHNPDWPIYVYQMNPVITRELALYSRAPCQGVSDPSQLPATARPYWMVLRQTQLAQVRSVLGPLRPVAQRNWAPDKTGILPRMLRLAKGVEPLEAIAIVQVGTLPYPTRPEALGRTPQAAHPSKPPA